MTFPKPLTLEELINDMHVLDRYYNCRQYQYEELPLPDLVLPKITFTPITEAEILAKANGLAEKKVAQMIAEFEGDIKYKIAVLEGKNGLYANILVNDKSALTTKYNELTEKYKAEAVKRGLVNSSSYVDGLANIASEKAAEITNLETASALKTAENTAEINALNLLLSSSVKRFENEKAYLVLRGVEDIKKVELDKELDVKKYNTQQEEKEQKGTISNNISLMRLRLLYTEVIEKRMTDDQLILAGYYIDIIKVVDAYFYSIDAKRAFKEFEENTIFKFQLGSFYGSVYTKYQTRSQNAV